MFHKIVGLLAIVFCCETNSLNAQSFTSLGGGMNRSVLKLFSDTINNKLYAGGEFAYAGGVQSHCFAIWDGVSWDSTRNQFPYPPTTQVRAITFFQDKIYVGGILGIFDTIGNQIGYGMAKWDTITKLWEPYYVYGSVASLYSDNNNLYVGGNFSNINNVQSHKIIRYDGISFYSYPPLDTVMSGWAVNAIISYNNELYVGGNFDSHLSSNMKDIAKWDGNQWMPVGNGLSGGFTWVNDFEIYQGLLIVGGAFKVSQGDPGNNVVGWDGSQWIPLGNGVLNGGVKGLAVYNNELWVGGLFSYADGFNIPVSYLAKWDGGQWYNVGLIPNSTVSDLAVLGNDLYISGNFKTMNGDTVNHIIKYNDLTGFSNNLVEINKISIYPNPAKTSIIISMVLNSIPEIVHIEIVDATGKIKYKKVMQSISNNIELSIDILCDGIYHCRVFNEKYNLVQKLVVAK